MEMQPLSVGAHLHGNNTDPGTPPPPIKQEPVGLSDLHLFHAYLGAQRRRLGLEVGRRRGRRGRGRGSGAEAGGRDAGAVDVDAGLDLQSNRGTSTRQTHQLLRRVREKDESFMARRASATDSRRQRENERQKGGREREKERFEV